MIDIAKFSWDKANNIISCDDSVVRDNFDQIPNEIMVCGNKSDVVFNYTGFVSRPADTKNGDYWSFKAETDNFPEMRVYFGK